MAKMVAVLEAWVHEQQQRQAHKTHKAHPTDMKQSNNASTAVLL
jgi:hypothetical protein